MIPNWKTILIILAACFLGGIGGWYARISYASKLPTRLIEVRENSTKYRFINPLLLVDSNRESPEFNSLKNTINDYINSAEAEKKADTVSVYFRDMNTGRWTGVDSEREYDPSSMLKVAVMIGYLKDAASDPNILLKKLPYSATDDPGQNYKPTRVLKSGSYTVRELIQAMIVDSDNDALNALYNNNRQSYIEVLKTLNIPPPPDTKTIEFMSPKTYAGLMRTLYSSTYLPRELSEQAMELLTYTTFNKGLVAGVPISTTVAHKFGEHTTVNLVGQVKSRELHDCGIVYHPGSPYFLCVMTHGSDFSKLESIISDISSIVYKNIDGVNP
jgi:beta-lactamase class A